MSEHHRTSEWQRTVRMQRPRLAATLPAPCIDCGRPINRGDRWQVGHRVPVAVAKAQGWTVAQINHPTNLGPTHAKAPGQKACNQIAGGKLGAKASASSNSAKRESTRRMPSW
jgi:hypothetical protein